MSDRHRVGFEDLQLLAGLEQPAAIERWLRREGIAYARDARCLPWTTLQSIERGLRRSHPVAPVYPYADSALEF